MAGLHYITRRHKVHEVLNRNFFVFFVPSRDISVCRRKIVKFASTGVLNSHISLNDQIMNREVSPYKFNLADADVIEAPRSIPLSDDDDWDDDWDDDDDDDDD